MNIKEERRLAEQLVRDDRKRDRSKYDYTVDALMEGGITPMSIWPESNQNVVGIIAGKIDYNSLPTDATNEFHKGGLFSEQQDIIVRNIGKEPLCEALSMKACLGGKCQLYESSLGPPVCREFKLVFKK